MLICLDDVRGSGVNGDASLSITVFALSVEVDVWNREGDTLFDDLDLVEFGEGDFLGEVFVAAAALDFEVPLSVVGEEDGLDVFGPGHKHQLEKNH